MVDRSIVPTLAAGLVAALLAWPGAAALAASEAAHDAADATLLRATPLGATAGSSGLSILFRHVVGYRDVDRAQRDGFEMTAGCSVSRYGSGGIVFTTAAAASDLVLATPQELVYAPLADGGLRLVAVGYRVDAEAWHGAGHTDPPALLEEVFREVLDMDGRRLYRLTVWILQFNPSGLFAETNPLLGCGSSAPTAGDGLP